MLEAAEATSARNWEAVLKRVEANYADMEQNGMTLVTEVPEEFLGALNEAGREALDDWLAKTGEKGRAIIEAYTAKKGVDGSRRAPSAAGDRPCALPGGGIPDLLRRGDRLSCASGPDGPAHPDRDRPAQLLRDLDLRARRVRGLRVAAMTFLSLGYALEDGSLIRVQLLPTRSPPPARRGPEALGAAPPSRSACS